MAAGNDIKRAQTDIAIEQLFADRWSPYAFDPRPVEDEKLLSVLEAARWAPSSFNEQPWSFIIARRQDTEGFDRMLGCLLEGNQGWARNAGVLMITVAQKNFSRNNKPNRVCEHDIGLAAANLTLQAMALGLHSHQMGGIDLTKCRHTYKIPQDYDPVTGIALGYVPDQSADVDPEMAQRDQAPRARKPLSDFVFEDAWQQSAAVTG